MSQPAPFTTAAMRLISFREHSPLKISNWQLAFEALKLASISVPLRFFPPWLTSTRAFEPRLVVYSPTFFISPAP